MSRIELAVRGGASVLLVCVAIVLVLAAHDVLAWRGQTERANVAVARFSSDPNVWQPRTWLPVAVSRWMLGTGDDVRFGRALQRLQVLRGRTPSGSFDPPRVELAKLELSFDAIARSSTRVTVRSRAQELHALVLFQQLLLQGSSDAAVDALVQTIGGLQHAVRTDPGNADAAYDLEALLNLYRPIAVEEASQLPYHRGEHGDTGAAGGSPGSGAVGAGGF